MCFVRCRRRNRRGYAYPHYFTVRGTIPPTYSTVNGGTVIAKVNQLGPVHRLMGLGVHTLGAIPPPPQMTSLDVGSQI
jgi:hypothetical protein